MYPAPFRYAAPTSLDEALSALGEGGDEARVLAGGQSLIPLLKLRLSRPAVLVDLGRVPGLDGITLQDGHLRLGALARHYQVASSPLVRRHAPLLANAVGQIADVQVRNCGTAGGSMALADPSGDWGTAALTLDASVVCVGPAGRRSIKASDFFVDMFTTALRPDEIITEVMVPVRAADGAGIYLKLVRRHGDRAICGVAVRARVDSDQRCTDVAIGLTAMGPTPIRATDAESLLHGQRLTREVVEAAADAAVAVTDPLADLGGSAAYKREVAKTLVQRALARATSGDGNEGGH